MTKKKKIEKEKPEYPQYEKIPGMTGFEYVEVTELDPDLEPSDEYFGETVTETFERLDLDTQKVELIIPYEHWRIIEETYKERGYVNWQELVREAIRNKINSLIQE